MDTPGTTVTAAADIGSVGIGLIAGTFDLAGYNWNLSHPGGSPLPARRRVQLKLGSGTLYGGYEPQWSIAGTNFTLDCGTSTIDFSFMSYPFNGGGYTYYDAILPAGLS